MKKSEIEWTDHTFNPWIGCTKVSPGCQHCYAETLMDKRFGRVKWGPHGERIRTSAVNWLSPLSWNRDSWIECPSCGWRGSVHDAKALDGITACPVCDRAHPDTARQRVFCASLSDVFEDRPELIPWRTDLFKLILATQNLDWLLLTKRPENVIGMTIWSAPRCILPANVWIGTSVENQEQADKRIPELLNIPAAVRFLSVEPLLEPVSIAEYYREEGNGTYSLWSDYIDWVIVGGESGPDARPMHPEWVRSIQGQCQMKEIPFLFKQWGEWKPIENANRYAFNPDKLPDTTVTMDENTLAQKVGKHAAGRLLDGQEWNGYPERTP